VKEPARILQLGWRRGRIVILPLEFVHVEFPPGFDRVVSAVTVHLNGSFGDSSSSLVLCQVEVGHDSVVQPRRAQTDFQPETD